MYVVVDCSIRATGSVQLSSFDYLFNMCPTQAGSRDEMLPPVQFLAGLSRSLIQCPGSREKGTGTLLCPPYVEFKLQPTSCCRAYCVKKYFLSKVETTYLIIN